jgi:hypothetical protein
MFKLRNVSQPHIFRALHTVVFLRVCYLRSDAQTPHGSLGLRCSENNVTFVN